MSVDSGKKKRCQFQFKNILSISRDLAVSDSPSYLYECFDTTDCDPHYDLQPFRSSFIKQFRKHLSEEQTAELIQDIKKLDFDKIQGKKLYVCTQAVQHYYDYFESGLVQNLTFWNRIIYETVHRSDRFFGTTGYVGGAVTTTAAFLFARKSQRLANFRKSLKKSDE